MFQIKNNLLISTVYNMMGVDVSTNKSRKREIVTARACIINVLSRYYGANTVEIGEMYEMDHSTIVYHLEHHAHRYRFEDVYSRLYDKLMQVAIKEDKSAIDVDEVLSLIQNALEV